jgi:hypothetical protein
MAGRQSKGNAAADVDPMMTRDTLAELLGLSVDTLSRWDSIGEGPVGIRIGRQVFYRVASVNEWLRSREKAKAAARAPKRGKAVRA